VRLHVLVAAICLGLVLMSCGGSNDKQVPAAPYLVLGWNDLGMHCLNPTYDQAVVLPPFNTLWAQVIERGDPPKIVTAGISVKYAVQNNTYSYGKRDYGQFWDNAVALFGSLFGITELPHNQGLAGNGLAGVMALAGDHFVAVGIPLTPVDDVDYWNPYQVARIIVLDAQGDTLAQTRATLPTSDEMHCSKCHGAEAFLNILTTHDHNEKTNLVGSAPVLCAGCHGDPALGQSGPGTSGKYLSQAMHTWHADKGAACYDCHPGAVTKCQRSIRHMAANGNCTTCHGDLAAVGGSIPADRIPWVNEPACAKCHGAVNGVATGSTLYRNALGHGGIYCAGCHGSPHAMIPSREASDNYQALQYQGFTGAVKTLGSCGVCHASSRGEEGHISKFGEVHGGSNPEHRMSCHVCHTVVQSDSAKWPHAYGWTDSKRSGLTGSGW
jgi:hypothetical protein